MLTLAEKIYGSLSGSYHRKWDKRGGWKAPVPVISVGNITVGGNGKTPFTIELVRLLSDRFESLRGENGIAILSRGYGRRAKDLCVVQTDADFKESGDEPLLIKRNSPSALVIAYANRVESARFAVEHFGAKLIILDDGFQHRPLARDLDIVLLDSERPLGNGHLLPAGRLRERPAALNRTDLIVSVGQEGAAEAIALKIGKPLMHATTNTSVPEGLASRMGPVYLLTAIARSSRVRQTAEDMKLNVVGHARFRDHHAFSGKELDTADQTARKLGASAILTTSKDMIRIPSWHGNLPLFEIPFRISLAESDQLLSRVEGLL
ncbi:MAG: tetraacyldisaccharide 4'-kinase [Calditrichaeota bacterium]|nr:tetraacyldisaccharide 4'-kinase [Calditrichota bacterium]